MVENENGWTVTADVEKLHEKLAALEVKRIREVPRLTDLVKVTTMPNLKPRYMHPS